MDDSIIDAQNVVVQFRKKIPKVMDNYYRKQLEILEEDVPLRYEESFQQPPEVHLPNDIVFGETPEIVDKQTQKEIKEQTKLMVLLQKIEKSRTSKVLDILCKD